MLIVIMRAAMLLGYFLEWVCCLCRFFGRHEDPVGEAVATRVPAFGCLRPDYHHRGQPRLRSAVRVRRAVPQACRYHGQQLPKCHSTTLQSGQLSTDSTPILWARNFVSSLYVTSPNFSVGMWNNLEEMISYVSKEIVAECVENLV